MIEQLQDVQGLQSPPQQLLHLDSSTLPIIYNTEHDDLLRNEYGSVRKHLVFSSFLGGTLTYPDCVDLYTEWRDDAEYFILRGYPEYLQATLTNDVLTRSEVLYKFIKASKRGNDVYKHLVEQKLKPLKELHNIPFFNDHCVDKRTCVIFVTLTYDNKRCDTETAWKNIGEEFHLFHNNLRKQYGNVEIFRTWESTNHYYPHVHAIILFEDRDFTVIQHKNKDGTISNRIPYKEKQKIAQYWHSNVDVQAIEDSEGAIRELTKYITKDLCSKKGDKTNTMIWLHGKQSYAISKGFAKAITGWDIEFNEPTNSDLINQMCNCNQQPIKWEFLGILRGKQLGFSSNVWCVDIKKPPPRVAEMLKNEWLRWVMVHGRS